MSNNATKTFDISTWTKGTRGWHAPAVTDKPKIVDMMLYTNGILGPRQLWSPVAILTANASDAQENVAGLLLPCVMRGTVDKPQGFLFVRQETTTAYNIDFYELTMDWFGAPNPTVTHLVRSTGTLSQGHSSEDMLAKDFWHTLIADNSWLINGVVVTARETSPYDSGNYEIAMTGSQANIESTFSTGGTFYHYGSTIHASRAYHWGRLVPGTLSTEFNLQRIYYSDAADYTTFTDAAQYFDLGGNVGGCMTVGSNLLLWTTDGRWYVLQGRGDPSDGTLTQVGHGPIPPVNYGTQGSMPVVAENKLMFQAAGRTHVVSVGGGGDIDDVSGIHLVGFQSDAYSASGDLGAAIKASSIHNTVLSPGLLSYGPGFYRRDGVWLEETTPTVFTGTNSTWSLTDRQFHDALSVETWVTPAQATSPTNPGLMIRRLHALEPSAENEFDPSTFAETETYTEVKGEVTLPRIFDPNHLIRVNKVIVDGVFYDSDDGIAHNLDVTVDCPRNTTSFTIVEGPDTLAATLAETAGAVTTQAFRAVYTPDDMLKHESWYDITLENIQMIGIERVTVQYEITNARTH